jgi:hypothetical protein
MLSSLTLTAVCCGFFFQLASTVVAIQTSGPPDPVANQTLLNGHNLPLLEESHSITDFFGLLLHNSLALIAFTVAALLCCRLEPRFRIAVRPRVGVAIASGLLGFSFFTLTTQATKILGLFAVTTSTGAATHPTPKMLLLVCLPHGPFEFGALLLPLLATLPFPGRDRATPRSVLRVLPCSFVLLAAAAFLESWVSPALLQLPLRGQWPG